MVTFLIFSVEISNGCRCCLAFLMQVEDRRLETEKRFISLRVKHESLEKAHAVAQQQLKKLKVSSFSCSRWVKSLPQHRAIRCLHFTDTLTLPHTTPSPFTKRNPSPKKWVDAGSNLQPQLGRRVSAWQEDVSSSPPSSEQAKLHVSPPEKGFGEQLDFKCGDPALGISLDRNWIKETLLDWEEEDFEDIEDGELWYDYGDLSSIYTHSRGWQAIAVSRACVEEEEEDGYRVDDPALQPFSYPGSPSLRSPPAHPEPITLASPCRSAASPHMQHLEEHGAQQSGGGSKRQPSVVHEVTDHTNSLHCTCPSEHPCPVGLKDAPVVMLPEGGAYRSCVTMLLICFATHLVWFVAKNLLDL